MGIVARCPPAMAGVGCLLLAMVLSATAQSAAEFYKPGVALTLIVSAGSGGGNDTYARSFAQYFVEHMPGKPSIVVQNMPGAGGLRATNHLYANAAKDGTVIALVHAAMPTAGLLQVQGTAFDASKFNWIGNLTRESQFCISWHESPIKTFDDAMTTEFIVGSAGSGGSMETAPIMFNNLFGTKMRVVAGYKGGNDVLLAMERGEVHGRCAWSMSGLQSTRPDWIKQKKINFVIQMALKKNPALPDVPFILDYAKNEEQKAILRLALAQQEMSRPLLAPPGVAVDRVATLRAAFVATVKDPAFLALAKKRRIDIAPTTGKEVQEFVKMLYETPKPVIQKTIKVFEK
jgi:tripartite-type tricarboxylate transporter receptor subunit TctC